MLTMPTRSHWFNPRAAKARLQDIDAEIAQLHQERALLWRLLGPGSGAAGSPATSGGARRGRPPGKRTGPTLSSLLAEAIQAGPSGKSWTAGELVAAVEKAHPGRLPGKAASGLVSAALAQAMRGKTPVFAARKTPGKRSKLYRLAGA
jgi:hypothetical protein